MPQYVTPLAGYLTKTRALILFYDHAGLTLRASFSRAIALIFHKACYIMENACPAASPLLPPRQSLPFCLAIMRIGFRQK